MTTALSWCAWRSADSSEMSIEVSASAFDAEAVPLKPSVLRGRASPAGSHLAEGVAERFVNVQPLKDHNGASTVSRVSRTICCLAVLVKP